MSEVSFTALRTETPKESVDRQMAAWREIAGRREQLLRLLKNKDFQELMMRFFLVEEAARYIQMAYQPGMGAQERADSLLMAQATGHVKRFFDVVERQGEQALVSLSEHLDNYEDLVRGEG